MTDSTLICLNGALAAAYTKIMTRSALRPDARISGVMVLRPKARELILGLADDPTFGTVVLFGHGGTAVEIINDKAAFVALDEAAGEIVGVVRIHSDSIYETGEYAILLRSSLKGRGLGWALMQLIIEYAKSEGLKTIWGDVLAENAVMLEMCRSLGFEVRPDPVEHDIYSVRLTL